MDKTLSQMSKEEKMQALLDYRPCRRQRQFVLCYILALSMMTWNRSHGLKASEEVFTKSC